MTKAETRLLSDLVLDGEYSGEYVGNKNQYFERLNSIRIKLDLLLKDW